MMGQHIGLQSQKYFSSLILEKVYQFLLEFIRYCRFISVIVHGDRTLTHSSTGEAVCQHRSSGRDL